MTLKSTNPKDAIGGNKLPLHLWPETATILGSLGLLDGALKYGRGNYRAVGVKASIYVDACRRHLTAWFEGEDLDPDSGLPHLAHALACLAILADAQAADKLTDDRQIGGGYRTLVEEMTPHVDRLKKLHADKEPKHYTIADDDVMPDINDRADVPTRESIEEMLLKGVRDTPQPAVEPIFPDWQQPHHYRWPLGGETMSNASGPLDATFDDEEITEMCRLAQSATVTLPLT